MSEQSELRDNLSDLKSEFLFATKFDLPIKKYIVFSEKIGCIPYGFCVDLVK